MSRVRTLRNAIRAALATLPDLAAPIAAGTVYIEDAPTVEHAWEAASGKPSIVIVYLSKGKEGGRLSTRVNDDFTFRFALVYIADSYQREDTLDGLYEAEEIAEMGMALRGVKLATMNGEPVYLAYGSEVPLVPPNRPVEGGRAGFAQTWESTKVRV